MIRGVTLDFDGTVVDHDQAIAAALAEAAEVAARLVPALELPAFFAIFRAHGTRLKAETDAAGLPSWRVEEQFVRSLREAGVGDPQAVASAIAPVFERRLARTAIPYPDAVEAVRELREIPGLRLGLLSNGESRVQRARIERSGLRGLFDAVIVTGDIRRYKPDPHCFAYAAKRLGVRIGELLHIGDDLIHDVHGARLAGAHSVWIHRSDSGADPGAEDVVTVPSLGGAVAVVREAVAGRAANGLETRGGDRACGCARAPR